MARLRVVAGADVVGGLGCLLLGLGELAVDDAEVVVREVEALVLGDRLQQLALGEPQVAGTVARRAVARPVQLERARERAQRGRAHRAPEREVVEHPRRKLGNRRGRRVRLDAPLAAAARADDLRRDDRAVALGDMDAAHDPRAAREAADNAEQEADRQVDAADLDPALGGHGVVQRPGHVVGADRQEGARLRPRRDPAAAPDAERHRSRQLVVDAAVELVQAAELGHEQRGESLDRLGVVVREVDEVLDHDAVAGLPEPAPGEHDGGRGEHVREGQPVEQVQRGGGDREPPDHRSPAARGEAVRRPQAAVREQREAPLGVDERLQEASQPDPCCGHATTLRARGCSDRTERLLTGFDHRTDAAASAFATYQG